MTVSILNFDSSERLDVWREGFVRHRIERPAEYYGKCYEGNRGLERITLFAAVDGVFAGCAHLLDQSAYPFFRERHIPEINDLIVFPEFRRQGIANFLLEHFERIARMKGKYVGIGVGLYKDYGAAQRIYCRRGYIPDGNGLMYRNQAVSPGSMVPADDHLSIYLVKDLHPS